MSSKFGWLWQICTSAEYGVDFVDRLPKHDSNNRLIVCAKYQGNWILLRLLHDKELVILKE